METITIGQCFRGSWCDAGDGLLYRPVLILAIFAALLYADSGTAQLHEAIRIARLSGDHAALFALQGHMVLDALVRLIAFAALAVHMMRHSLFGGADGGLPPLYRSIGRYIFTGFGFGLIIACCIALVIGGMLLIEFLVFPHHANTSPADIHRHLTVIHALFKTIGSWLTTFILIRATLLLCNRSIGGRASWSNAWQTSSGHFWKMAITQLLAASPIFFIAVIVLAASKSIGIELDMSGFNAAVGRVIFEMACAAVSATCTAWLYRRFAAQLD